MNLLVLGDSHARVFEIPFFKNRFPNLKFDVCSVDGATISGLSNPNSKTNSMVRFIDALEKSCAEKILLLLGEVDLGFVLWYRAQKYNENVLSMMQIALDNYSKLITECQKKVGNNNVICLSSPLPTIPDNDSLYGEVANARSAIKATQLERTELTLKFNLKLKKICEDNGAIFLGLDHLSKGENGLVSNKLLNTNMTDHHYNKFEYAKMMLNPLIYLLSIEPPENNML